MAANRRGAMRYLILAIAAACLCALPVAAKRPGAVGTAPILGAALKSRRGGSSSPAKHLSLLPEDRLRGGGDAKPKKPREKSKTKSFRAGLSFPVGRIHRILKERSAGKRVAGGAAVYLAAVLEYLTAEVLELAGNAAKDNKKTRIIPRHIQLAIRNDQELNKLLGGVTIAAGGVLPNIHSQLLPKEALAKAAAAPAKGG
uniref:Histone H2A n=1 Tax=Hemiselmis andersenii TaxID=464988 RepID=A0A6U4NLD9_HEMAN|mmetsp:Transcript_31944/g.77977  ORF Transcript_31944/g.77977 Transcript_31944/m.77977 type:complete len:200 (+) Transcript_31944:249-848(+)